jgi:quercetin dioxygenase-like cupin family protein
MKILHYQDLKPSPVTHEEAGGVNIRWLISKEDGAPNFAMRLFEVASGGHTPLHTHAWEHEVFVIDGQGVVWRDGEEVPVGPGTAIYVPPEEKHCFKNSGEAVFRFICLVPMSAV